MLTIEEYKEKYKDSKGIDENGPMTFWFNAIDCVAHILKFSDDTFFPTNRNGASRFIETFRNGISQGRDDFEEYDEVFDNAFIPTKRYKPEMNENSGELSIDAYINGSKKPFEQMVEVLEESKKAISMFINFGLNYGERHGTDVERAYKEAYKIAASCEADNRPCRVVGTFGLKSETGRNKIRIMVVLKDYDDPIFPTIWGGIRDNVTAHSLACVLPVHLLGTRDGSIGTAIPCDISDLVDGEEEDVMIFGNKIYYRK